jgi:uncharacterized membrane protein
MMGGSSPIGSLVPKQFADMSMHILAPKRQVVVDMVMVQLISAIIVFMGILVFKNHQINQMEMSIYMMGIFVSFILLTQIYQRITRVYSK